MVGPWRGSSACWEPTYNASLISPEIRLEDGCRTLRTVRTGIPTVCIIGGLTYKETSHKKPKKWKKLSYTLHIVSQEGCLRKVWTNFYHLRNPDNSEGVGEVPSGRKPGSQNRTGGPGQGNELIYYRRRRRQRSLGDRKAQQAEVWSPISHNA